MTLVIVLVLISSLLAGAAFVLGYEVRALRRRNRALLDRVDPDFDPGPLSPESLGRALRNPRLFAASRALDRVQSAFDQYMPKENR